MDEFEWFPADVLSDVCKEKIAMAFEKKMSARSKSGYFIGLYFLIGAVLISINGEWERFAFTLPVVMILFGVLFATSKNTAEDEHSKIQNLSYEWREGSLTKAMIRSKRTDYFYVDKQKCLLLPFQNQRSWGNCPKKGDAMVVVRIMLQNGKYERYAVKKDILLK